MGPLIGLLPLEGGGFHSPSVSDFDTPSIFPGVPWLSWVNKPMIWAFISLIGLIVFWLVMSNKRSLVPTKGQFAGEYAYAFVRNTIARDTIGAQKDPAGNPEFRKYVPFLLALFYFLLVNNLFGIVPFILLPTASHVGWAYAWAVMVWILFNAIGIRRHGFASYIRHSVLPSGVPKWMWPLIIPLEFFSNIIVRPITLSLRLFANMFAGHLVVLLFVAGGEYLLLHTPSILNKSVGVLSLIFSMGIFGLEAFVQALQAFIFTILTAVYINSSLAEEH